MRASVVISALVAVMVGFGGSIAIILAAAAAVGATPAQTTSWVAMLCVSMMVTTGILSVRHRMPIVAAWSTPGAALIAATEGVSMEAAVGAFLLAGGLILVTALFRSLNAAIQRIPTSIASAMLAGILFAFVVSVFHHLQNTPALVLPLVLAFALLRLFSPAWAVLAVLAVGIVLSYGLDMTGPIGELRLSGFVWVTPEFEPSVLLGVGLPLFIVTMASQNLPGFAVLQAAGYRAPSQSILAVTGLASVLTAGFCAHTTNLAAITASICTGPDAHPDKDKRWLCGPIYALGYGMLAVFGASVVTIFASFPAALIAAVAGIALMGPFVGALAASMAEDRERFAAAVTFVVTASGYGVLGVGSAFWGLVAGLAVAALARIVSR